LIFFFLITLFLITVNSCEKTFREVPENTPESIFEEIWSTFLEEYAPFRQRDVDWEEQYLEYRPMVGPSTTDEELFDIMGSMLATLDDGHVSLVAPGREVYFSNAVRRERRFEGLFDPELIREHYLEPGFRSGEAGSYCYGRIRNENIGYIFFDHVGENFKSLNEFLDEYQEADGLIIDMRHNKGGDFTYCFKAMGRLTGTDRMVFRSKTKNGPGADDYTPWTDWYIRTSGRIVDSPIAVLTDRYTISAGERSVMAFMTLPNVTVIGDTTNGAHGTMIGRELANGWYYTLVPQIVEYKNGQSYEGRGLPPDQYIRNLREDVEAGIDSTLSCAIDLICQTKK